MTDATRLRLDVSYDGREFSGWAVQPSRRTVAGVLVEAFGGLPGERLVVVGMPPDRSGRGPFRLSRGSDPSSPLYGQVESRD